MKLVEIAKEPSLIRLELDDEDTIKEFGEPLEFWCYDRQPLDTFMKFASQREDTGAMITLIKDLILDEHGAPVMQGNAILPSKIMIRVAHKLMEKLGN